MKKNNNRHKKLTSDVYFINDIPNIYSIGGIIEDAVPYLGAASTALQLGLTLFGSQGNTAAINQIKQNINDVLNTSFNTGSSNDLLLDFNELTLIGHISKSDLGKEGLFSNKLGRMAGRLNNLAALANMAFYNNFNKAALDLSLNLILSALSSGNIAAYGGDIHIKPENRGKFTALKERTGKSATWFKEHGTPALKKMATFALNAKKWKHEDGGPLFIESLPEITVTPTNDANFLFSQGRYKVSSRPPLGDKNIRKLVANYLSKYDNENAEEYNKRISRLADAIYEPGILFKTNKKDRAYYSPSTGIAYIKTMDDFFGELAHPYLEARGTFKPIHELSEENYDNDKDYRGGTRYAYPDTFEGETHGFFEPALSEWITTGKIGKSSPVINKRQSNEKIVPKDIEEVTDSAASWSKLAAIKRIISKPNLLPFLKRIKYKLIDFPLRDSSRNIIYPKKEQKKYAFGGELTHGGIFNNGINIIGNGGTHEENPYDGIQVGVDELGIPNLVELDELIWNDYVFSNRLKVPKAVREKYKLRGNKELTFADAAKQMQKESEERPNDPISLRGLEDIMNKLQDEQETIRMQKKNNKSNRFDIGGDIYINGNKRNRNIMDFYNIDVPTLVPNISQRFDELKLDIAHTRYNNRSLSDNSLTDDKDNFLRYIPALGNTLGAVATLFSKPDTSGARMIMNKANQALDYARVNPTYLNDYLRYEPEDTDYLANRMAANAGAARANIINLSGGNRANMMAGLLGANYASNTAIGDAYRQGILDDMQKRERYATFNRGTSLANQEAALKAAIANQQAKLDADKIGLSGYTTAASMIDAIDAQRAKTFSANLTNLFESLGQIGEELYDKNRLKWLERKGVLRSDYFDTGKYNSGRN